MGDIIVDIVKQLIDAICEFLPSYGNIGNPFIEEYVANVISYIFIFLY